MRNLIILLLVIGIGLGFTLCHKPDTTKTTDETEISKDINALEVNDNFKWKTIKDIQISLKSSSDNVAYIKSPKGEIYLKVFLLSNQVFDSKITVPSYANDFVVECGIQSKEVSIIGNNMSVVFN